MLPSTPSCRILVMGPSGAGKSTLARRIGAKLGLPVVHLDRLFWRPGWAEPTRAEFRSAVAIAAAGNAWVMDGNYVTQTIDLRLPRADLILYLDFPRRVTMPRALWRSLSGFGRSRVDMAAGCPEKLDPVFWRYMWDYPRKSRPKHLAALRAAPAHVRQVVLRTDQEVAAFLESL